MSGISAIESDRHSSFSSATWAPARRLHMPNVQEGIAGIIHRVEPTESSLSLPIESARDRERREAYEKKGVTLTGYVYLAPEGPGPGQRAWRFQETSSKPEVDVVNLALSNGDYLTISAPPDSKKPTAIKQTVWEGTVGFHEMLVDSEGKELSFAYPKGEGLEGLWANLFSKRCPAEIRIPDESGTIAAAGEIAKPDSASAVGTARVRNNILVRWVRKPSLGT